MCRSLLGVAGQPASWWRSACLSSWFALKQVEVFIQTTREHKGKRLAEYLQDKTRKCLIEFRVDFALSRDCKCLTWVRLHIHRPVWKLEENLRGSEIIIATIWTRNVTRPEIQQTLNWKNNTHKGSCKFRCWLKWQPRCHVELDPVSRLGKYIG